MRRLRLARYFRRRVLRRKGAEMREQQAIELVGKCREHSDSLPKDGFSLVTRLDLVRLKRELDMLAADCGGIVDKIRCGQHPKTSPVKRRFARIVNSLQQASVRDGAWTEAALKLRQGFRDALKRSASLNAISKDRRHYYEKAFQIRLEEASRSRDPDAALASARRILQRLEEEAELPSRVMNRTRIVSDRVEALEQIAERFGPVRPDCDEATTLMKRAETYFSSGEYRRANAAAEAAEELATEIEEKVRTLVACARASQREWFSLAQTDEQLAIAFGSRLERVLQIENPTEMLVEWRQLSLYLASYSLGAACQMGNHEQIVIAKAMGTETQVHWSQSLDRHQLVRFAVICGMTGEIPSLPIEEDSNSSTEEEPSIRELKKKPRRPPIKYVYENRTPVCASCGSALKQAMLVWEPSKRFCRSCRLARRFASLRDTGPQGNA
jgi:tetratricopeptide (TPR) repeat protein